MTLVPMELAYLGRSGLEIGSPVEDVRGLAVVGPDGLRLGEVEDLVIDRRERRARLLSVVSGGVLGLAASRFLVPVETVTKVDDRVRVDRSHAAALPLSGDTRWPDVADLVTVAAVYERYDVPPCWEAAGTLA